MSLFANLRSIVFLRRSVRALERLADAESRLADLAYREWEERHPIPRSASVGRKPVEVAVFDLAEAEKRHRQRNAEMMVDEDDGA